MADSRSILSLFSGSGYLDEAVRSALRAVWSTDSRVLGYIEREAHAAALLLARMEAATVERAPVFCGDIADLDARPLRGHVDIVCASPPCQPYSIAGKRRGNSDERSWGGDGRGPLWHTIRVIGECRPALVYFENVGEWVTDGHFREFGEQLCDLGYDIAPPLFLAAEDVGAPHERERVFILGYAKCSNSRAGIAREQGEARIGWSGPYDAIAELAERSRGGRRERGESSGCYGLTDGSDDELADAHSARREGQEPARRVWCDGCAVEFGRSVSLFPPGRNEYGRWAALFAGGLDPAYAPAIESGVSVVADGLGSAAELLRLGGNGVIPSQAALAFAILLDGVLRGTEGTEVKTYGRSIQD